MNKQIEEMARDICEWYRHGICSLDDKECDLKCTKGSIVEKLVNRGYRKQSDGEWIYNTDDFTPKLRCTVCGYNKPIAAGEGISQEPKNFCPNCGARMKGEGDEENHNGRT